MSRSVIVRLSRTASGRYLSASRWPSMKTRPCLSDQTSPGSPTIRSTKRPGEWWDAKENDVASAADERLPRAELERVADRSPQACLCTAARRPGFEEKVASLLEVAPAVRVHL